jgi:CubicO group peptidase (beta-lactamase class C family)
MPRRRVPVAVSVLLLAATVVARADRTDDYIKAQMDTFHLPGLSLVVIKDGEIIKAAGYGFADVERRIAATPETVNRFCE